MNSITFNGETFPGRWIYFPAEGHTYLVSIESLDRKLFSNGVYATEEAERIDNQIFFFVPDEIIYEDDAYIQKFVEEAIA